MNELVNYFFVTSSSTGKAENQGRVREIVGDCCMVTLFSWIDGSPTGSYLVPLNDVVNHFTFTGRTAKAHDEFVRMGRTLSTPPYSIVGAKQNAGVKAA